MSLKNSLLYFILSFSLFQVACSNKKNPVQADKNVEDSLSFVGTAVSNNDLGVTSHHNVVIKKSALDKEFLFQAQLITQSMVPMFENKKSRVVAFKKDGQKVHLLEATQGHVVTQELPAKLLLSTYPIVSENEESLTIDFNKGMKELFMAGDWRGHGTSPNYNKDVSYASVSVSFIDHAEFTENTLVLNQVARITANGSSMPVAMKYYISPYAPSSSFVPSKAPRNFDKRGYFEISPFYNQNGNVISYSSKFDHSKPIVFAVSANTPADYKQAFKDGILYWNKAFGREIVQVVDAPAGVSAPDLKYNIVQWVPWDSAGFAYADAQMDPRTGEILHAQVFMTSVFAVSSRYRVKQLLRKINSHPSHHPSFQVGLKGFHNHKLCDLEVTNSWTQALETMANDENLTDNQILQASQDYVREVIAHEVGHTLGLRHNFAGNLVTNYSNEARPKMLKNYLLTTEAPEGAIPSSSVMEYQVFLEGAISGDIIEKGTTALQYDVQAIGDLYDHKEYATWPLFCTDDHASTYQDCKRFDYGKSLVNYVHDNEKNTLEKMPHTILGSFENAKAPRGEAAPISVDAVAFEPDKLAASVYGERAKLLEALSEKGKLLQVHRKYGVVDALNQEQVRQEELALLYADINKIGGLDKVIPPISPDYSSASYAELEHLLNNDKYKKGTGFDGREYRFSDAEINTIKQRAEVLYSKLQLALAKASMTGLTAAIFTAEKENDNTAALMKSYLDAYVYQKTGHQLEIEIEVKTNSVPINSENSETENKITVELPVYLYPTETRAMSVALLARTHSKFALWNETLKAEATKQFKSELKTILTTDDLTKIKTEGLNRDARVWLADQTSLLTGMSKL